MGRVEITQDIRPLTEFKRDTARFVCKRPLNPTLRGLK